MSQVVPNHAQFKLTLNKYSNRSQGPCPVVKNAVCEFSYQWNFNTNEGSAILVSVNGTPVNLVLNAEGLAGRLEFMSDTNGQPVAVKINGQTVYIFMAVLKIELSTGDRSALALFNQNGSCIEATDNFDESALNL